MKLEKFSLLLLAFVFSIVSIGCDSNDDEDPLEAFLGDWMQVESDPDTDVFVRVTQDELTVAASSTLISTVACSILQIDDYNPDTGVLSVTDSDGDPGTASIRASGDNVIVDGDTYMRSNSFPTCTVVLSIQPFRDTLERSLIPGVDIDEQKR